MKHSEIKTAIMIIFIVIMAASIPEYLRKKESIETESLSCYLTAESTIKNYNPNIDYMMMYRYKDGKCCGYFLGKNNNIIKDCR